MTEQTSLNVDDGAEDDSDFRDHEHDATPMPIIRQGLQALATAYPHLPGASFVHVDQCAGAGAFSIASKDIFRGRSHAFEIRESERVNLSRNADTSVIGDVRIVEKFEGSSVSLWATNPAFSLLADLLEQALANSTARTFVLYLGLSEWGQRGVDAAALFHRFPPIEQFRIQGALGFRGLQINPKSITKACPEGKPYGTDLRSYSWWLWRADGLGGSRWGGERGGVPTWSCSTLPRLEARERKWKTRPGTVTT